MPTCGVRSCMRMRALDAREQRSRITGFMYACVCVCVCVRACVCVCVSYKTIETGPAQTAQELLCACVCGVRAVLRPGSLLAGPAGHEPRPTGAWSADRVRTS